MLDLTERCHCVLVTGERYGNLRIPIYQIALHADYATIAIQQEHARAESLQADYLGMCQVVRDRDATIESLQSQLAAAQEALKDASDYILNKASRHDLYWRDGHAIIDRIAAAQSGEQP